MKSKIQLMISGIELPQWFFVANQCPLLKLEDKILSAQISQPTIHVLDVNIETVKVSSPTPTKRNRIGIRPFPPAGTILFVKHDSKRPNGETMEQNESLAFI